MLNFKLNYIKSYYMANITNFSLNQEIENDLEESTKEIHIRVKKTRGRKCITTIENIDVINEDTVYLKQLFRYFRKKLCHTNGAIDNKEKTIVLFGDQREKVKQYLVIKGIMKEENIKMHGF